MISTKIDRRSGGFSIRRHNHTKLYRRVFNVASADACESTIHGRLCSEDE